MGLIKDKANQLKNSKTNENPFFRVINPIDVQTDKNGKNF